MQARSYLWQTIDRYSINVHVQPSRHVAAPLHLLFDLIVRQERSVSKNPAEVSSVRCRGSSKERWEDEKPQVRVGPVAENVEVLLSIKKNAFCLGACDTTAITNSNRRLRLRFDVHLRVNIRRNDGKWNLNKVDAPYEKSKVAPFLNTVHSLWGKRNIYRLIVTYSMTASQ